MQDKPRATTPEETDTSSALGDLPSEVSNANTQQKDLDGSGDEEDPSTPPRRRAVDDMEVQSKPEHC